MFRNSTQPHTRLIQRHASPIWRYAIYHKSTSCFPRKAMSRTRMPHNNMTTKIGLGLRFTNLTSFAN